MDRAKDQSTRRLNFYCQVIILLLAAIALRLWMMPAAALPVASAQTSRQVLGTGRLQLIDQAKKTNALLADVKKALNGTLKVRIEGQNHGSRKKQTKGK